MHIHPILRNHKALKAVRQTPKGTFLFIYHHDSIACLTQCCQTGSKSSKARSQHLLISEMISYKHQEHLLP